MMPSINTRYRDREWLYQKYWAEMLSMPQIGRICGCDRKTVKYWMKKHQIKRRSQSEANKLAFSDPELRKRISQTLRAQVKLNRKPLWIWLWDGFKEWRRRR